MNEKLHKLTGMDGVLSVFQNRIEIDRDGSVEKIPIGDLESAVLSGEALEFSCAGDKVYFEIPSEKATLATRVVGTINRLINGEIVPIPDRSKKGGTARTNKLFGVIAVAVIVIVAFFGVWWALVPSNSSLITLSEFNEIQNGMTYEQVCEIIGGPGELSSEVDHGIGSEYVTQLYMWKGSGDLGANANVMFQGGVVVTKAQAGLK